MKNIRYICVQPRLIYYAWQVEVSYDKIKNKFIYKRTLPITTNNFKMYLRIINSEDFLGFIKMIEIN